VSEAEGWAFDRRRSTAVLLDPKFIRNLHRHMLGEVWKWAGTYRTLGANVGVDPRIIQVELRKLLDDARYWLDHATYSPDEIAVRFHHRLVAIHPFPNGNGRISRLMADLLIAAQGGERFAWGRSRGGDENRTRYLAALRAADDGDCGPLVVFARLP
jgi:Fic-DOC domain mobile mystery protein B